MHSYHLVFSNIFKRPSLHFMQFISRPETRSEGLNVLIHKKIHSTTFRQGFSWLPKTSKLKKNESVFLHKHIKSIQLPTKLKKVLKKQQKQNKKNN